MYHSNYSNFIKHQGTHLLHSKPAEVWILSQQLNILKKKEGLHNSTTAKHTAYSSTHFACPTISWVSIIYCSFEFEYFFFCC